MWAGVGRGTGTERQARARARARPLHLRTHACHFPPLPQVLGSLGGTTLNLLLGARVATPFFGTEYDLGHMQLDPALRGNVRFAYYPSGHMVYLNPEALKSMKSDLAKFYDEAAPR